MLKLEKVTGGYANIPVLKDVTFEVADGELVVSLVLMVLGNQQQLTRLLVS